MTTRVAGTIEARPELRSPTAVVIDEFGAFGADHVLGLFQRARSVRMSLLLSTQELADLRRIDAGFQDQVLGNVETVIAHRQNVPDSAELVASLAGTEEIWEHTFQTNDRLDRHGGSEQTGLGTKRRGHQFLIAPDTVKQLSTGQAVVIQKNPHTAKRVEIFTPEPPTGPASPDSANWEARVRERAHSRYQALLQSAAGVPPGADDEEHAPAEEAA